MHFTILNGRFLKPTGFALNLKKKTVQSVQINLAVNIKHLQHPKKTNKPKTQNTKFSRLRSFTWLPVQTFLL